MYHKNCLIATTIVSQEINISRKFSDKNCVNKMKWMKQKFEEKSNVVVTYESDA